MRLDSSVVGERAGGAGGGASRPTPVTKGVSDISDKIYIMKNTFRSCKL